MATSHNGNMRRLRLLSRRKSHRSSASSPRIGAAVDPRHYHPAAMAASTDRAIEVRAARPDDHAAVLELLSASLGWSADRSASRRSSPGSTSGTRSGAPPRGSRSTTVRWSAFARSCAGSTKGLMGVVYRTVRAVDTATRPTHQGRGIFRLLTLRALDDLRTQGTAFVFNTPNDQSRPGYLKMGWSSLGRVPITARITSPASPLRMLRSRVPAERWSTPSSFGHDAREVLADSGVSDLLATMRPPDGLRTHLHRRIPALALWVRAPRLPGRGPLRRCGGRVRRLPPPTTGALARVRAVRGACPGAALRRPPSGSCEPSRAAAGPTTSSAWAAPRSTSPGSSAFPVGVRSSRGVRCADDLPGARLEEWKLGLGDVELF